MFTMAVYAVLAVWGGVLAALIGWIACSVVTDTAATICPRLFSKRTHSIYLRKPNNVVLSSG